MEISPRKPSFQDLSDQQQREELGNAAIRIPATSLDRVLITRGHSDLVLPNACDHERVNPFLKWVFSEPRDSWTSIHEDLLHQLASHGAARDGRRFRTLQVDPPPAWYIPRPEEHEKVVSLLTDSNAANPS